MRLPLLLAALPLLACSKPDAAPPSLVSEAKQALAERERRLHSFSLSVDTTQGDATAHHEVAFRSPNKSRGRLTAPQDLELAFDGKALVRIDHGAKSFEVMNVELPPAERAMLLASTFMPFVPEGYRSPLLPSKVEASPVKASDGARVVVLTVTPEPGVSVRYMLKLPSGDFMEKRTEAGGSVRVLRVGDERCDEALKLCVPLSLVETLDGKPLGTTTLTKVELNPELPAELFAPKPREGYVVRQPAP